MTQSCTSEDLHPFSAASHFAYHVPLALTLGFKLEYQHRRHPHAGTLHDMKQVQHCSSSRCASRCELFG